MLGKQVVGTDALVVGTVKDLAVSSDGRVALQVTRKNQEGGDVDVFLGSDEIMAVGDVILLKNASKKAGAGLSGEQTTQSSASSASSTVSPPPSYPTNTSTTGKTCSRCGYTNNASSRFCIKCGNSLQ